MSDGQPPRSVIKRTRPRWVLPGLLLCALLGAAGVWALLHPAGLWLQPWRAMPSLVASRFIFGPYPLESDLVELKNKGVTTVISLLDPVLPYEKILLDQERQRAAKHGLKVLNFPMASILGQSFGKDYLANSRAAAQAAIGSDGIVYIHCYLGMHRARHVRDYLEDQAMVSTTTHEGALKAERPPDVQALDRANLTFMNGEYAESLRELADIRVRSDSMNLLEAWSNYRLGNIEAARAGFARVVARRPDSADARGGLAYCDLQDGNLDAAAQGFKRVLSAHPGDTQSLAGLGHVRYRQGRLKEARPLFERVLRDHPDDGEARDFLEKLKATP